MSNTLLERLKSLHPQSIDLSLGRIERLLAALGNPQDKLPPVVHVAGTNGKGSTLAFLRAIEGLSERAIFAFDEPPPAHPIYVHGIDAARPLTYVGVSEGARLGSSLPPSAPEVPAALLVAADDIEALADGLDQVLSSEPVSAALVGAGLARARQFTWERCAEQTCSSYLAATRAST